MKENNQKNESMPSRLPLLMLGVLVLAIIGIGLKMAGLF
jgi:hypothetical protein